MVAIRELTVVTKNFCTSPLTGSLHLSVYDQGESFQEGHLDIPKSATSERWTGLSLCPSSFSGDDSMEKYFKFSGTPGVRFTLEVSQDKGIVLDDPKEFEINERNTVNVFQFIPPKDISKTQLDITVTSDSDVNSYLKVSRKCKDVKDNINVVDYKGESIRLSFAKKGRITLSKVSIPRLTDSTESWYIGIALNNADGRTPLNASKTGYLTLTKSFNYSYWIPMLFICLVPFCLGFLVTKWALYCFKEPHVSPSTSNSEKNVTWRELCRAMVKVLCTYWFAEGHKTYSYITCIVGCVLIVGAFQFVFAGWYLMIQEGDRDHCYYNDFCYRVSNYDIPFNLMSSNFVYIVHALILLVSVWYMESELLARCLRSEKPEDKKTFSFSIGYAFGWALLFEGLFSLIYHLCPTKMTFQFDLAFMFVILGLIVVVTYNGIKINHLQIDGETRGHVGASNFYLGFIVPLYILNYIAALHHSKKGLIPTACWAIPLSIWAFFIFNWVGYKLYLEDWCFLIFWNCCCKANSSQNIKKLKCLTPAVGLIAAVLLFWFIDNLPNALLFTCITESAILTFWRFNKCLLSYCACNKDRKLKGMSILFCALTVVLGGVALMFFFIYPATDKAVAPEKSRNHNHECFFIGFFDYHDLWHILSSFALLMGVHIVMFASHDPDTEKNVEKTV